MDQKELELFAPGIVIPFNTMLRTFYAAGLLASSLLAQAPLKFDIATVKPNSADDHRISIQIQPGARFTATGATLRMLMAQAYDVRDFQISGGPAWISTERFDINAKAEGAPDRLPPE